MARACSCHLLLPLGCHKDEKKMATTTTTTSVTVSTYNRGMILFWYCLVTMSLLIPEAHGLIIPHQADGRLQRRRVVPPNSRNFVTVLVRSARQGDEDDELYDEYYDDDDIDDGEEDYSTQQRRRRRRRGGVDDLGGTRGPLRKGLDVPSSFGRRDGWRLPESVSKALLAGVFVMGVGLGVTVDSAINTNPRDLASRDAIDQAAPNPGLCATMGASAMAFDQRVFVSFNPFNVYVAQADVKPACVLRQSNVVSILREKHLIDDAEVRSCKANMNTWAFVGNLNDNPQLSCVYKSEDAQNEFLSNPKYGIGEDYLDDDRASESLKKSIKNEMTEGQRQERRRIQSAKIPGLD